MGFGLPRWGGVETVEGGVPFCSRLFSFLRVPRGVEISVEIMEVYESPSMPLSLGIPCRKKADFRLEIVEDPEIGFGV